MPPGSSAPDTVIIAITTVREEMSHVGPLSRDVFLDTFLYEHIRAPEEVLSMIDLIEYFNRESSPDSDNLEDDMALRLAFTGTRWMS